jgi:hypothetical protein
MVEVVLRCMRGIFSLAPLIVLFSPSSLFIWGEAWTLKRERAAVACWWVTDYLLRGFIAFYPFPLRPTNVVSHR